MSRTAEFATIGGTVIALLSLIISVLAFVQADPHSRKLKASALGIGVVVLVAMSFFVGRMSAIRTQSSAVSSTASSSTVKPVYHDSSVRVAQKSLNRVKRPGEELSPKFLVRKILRIDWNGDGKVSLSGDNNGSAPIWVDDILDISIVNPDGQEQSYYQNFSSDCTKGVNSDGAGVDLTKYLVPGENTINVTIADDANCAGKNGTVGKAPG
jgi:hypothetical protein